MRHEYLPYEDFLDIGEGLNYGQSVRVNHTNDCDGSSKSLKVEKKHDGSISAYCFRCGRRGYYSSKTALKSKILGDIDTSTVRYDSTGIQVPSGAETVFGEWSSARARLWIKKYGITPEEVEENGIFYNPSDSRVWLPVYNNKHSIQFVSRRRISDTDVSAKYLSDGRLEHSILVGSNGSNVVVLVEDMLSAIKVARHCQAMPLFSTNVRDIHVKTLIDKGIDTFVLWLDDDNIQVRRETLRNQKLLNKIGTCYTIKTNGKDPKEHTDEEIVELLLGVLS